ncbi:MAG: acyl-CoA thioesterase [Phormidesmis sp.]
MVFPSGQLSQMRVRGFQYHRVIRFNETDAAGVVYFANLLTLCHEAYEASLGAAGFNLGLFFSRDSSVAVPIVHTESDFYQPLGCGDAIAIFLTPKQLTPHSFEVSYSLYHQDHIAQASNPTNKAVVRALTRHMCINPQTRRRQPLTAELTDWITSFAEPTAS